MASEPLLSIVVPTKNRLRTLEVLVDHVMAWPSDLVEVIVQDNSDDAAEAQQLVARYAGDARFQYQHVSGFMSAIENCELAVARAQGTILAFVGDDDLVTVQTLDVAGWMKANNVDGLASGLAAYIWPDLSYAAAVNNASIGTLVVPTPTGTFVKLSSETVLRQLLRSAAQDILPAPRLYQGFIARSTMRRVRERCGTFFPGPAPDMASAVAVLALGGNFYSTDIPLVVSGQSKSSMSGRHALRKHIGRIEDEETLPPGTADRWNRFVPRYWSVPTIWAQTALDALDRVGATDKSRWMNFAKLYALCLVYDGIAQRSFVLRAVLAWPAHQRPWIVAELIFWFGLETGRRALRYAGKRLSTPVRYSFDDCAKATHFVETTIDKAVPSINFPKESLCAVS
jgi:glycosyltransferase involved in cell wall biosynthesis